ncbi:hypothetical protein ISCGN_015853 [Ixodes scapularis]
MASEARSIAVTLTGGGPWGFRLRGGRGTGTPLTVLKTRRKSKAHQVLLEGDVLVSVNGTPCDSLSHDQVMAIVDSGCAELRLQLLRGGTDPSNKENVRTEVPWSSPVWAPKSGDALANLKGTSLQSESSPRCLREVQSSVERDKDPSTGALRETHTTLEKESQKGPGSVSQVLSSLFPPGEANITPPRREPLSAEESPGPNRTLEAPSELPREERAMDREKVSLTPGSIINVPLGATLEMQLKLPTDTVVPEGQASTIKKTTESRMESQQTKRVAQCGDHSIAESSHAVQKLMSDSRSMVSQSSFESNEAQRITKTTAQQSLTETTKVSSSLPSGGSMYSLTVTNRSTTTTTDPKKVAPPTAPKPKLWLNTDIKSDVQRFGFPPERPASSASDASLPGQGVPQQGSPLLSPTGLPLLPKFYEPPGDNNSAMDFDAFKHHKKKTFSSSSFYEEPNCIYPTVEEQVELARKIADSLSADTNRTSRGANMFFKRVKRSHKWIHEAPDYSDSEATLSGTETSREDDRTPDPLNVPYKVSKGPPRLKLILDPRHLQDANTLRQSGISIVEHSAISPEVCLDLVKDLNSPCGKGAAMFAKRKKKSEEWVVDVDRIKAQLGDRWPEPHQPVAPIRTPIKTPVDRFKESLVNPRLRGMERPPHRLCKCISFEEETVEKIDTATVLKLAVCTTANLEGFIEIRTKRKSDDHVNVRSARAMITHLAHDVIQRSALVTWRWRQPPEDGSWLLFASKSGSPLRDASRQPIRKPVNRSQSSWREDVQDARGVGGDVCYFNDPPRSRETQKRRPVEGLCQGIFLRS